MNNFLTKNSTKTRQEIEDRPLLLSFVHFSDGRKRKKDSTQHDISPSRYVKKVSTVQDEAPDEDEEDMIEEPVVTEPVVDEPNETEETLAF